MGVQNENGRVFITGRILTDLKISLYGEYHDYFPKVSISTTQVGQLRMCFYRSDLELVHFIERQTLTTVNSRYLEVEGTL